MEMKFELTAEQKESFREDLEDFLMDHTIDFLYQWMEKNVDPNSKDYDEIYDKNINEAYGRLCVLVNKLPK